MAQQKRKVRSHDYVQKDKSLTKQSDRGPSMSELVGRFMHSGQPIPQLPWQVGDLANFNFEESRNLVADFQSHFEELPSSVRDHFHNDAAQYSEWIDANASEIDSDGLSAVLRDYLSPEPESGSEGVTDAPAQDSAQNGATEPDAGTEQTSSPT